MTRAEIEALNGRELDVAVAVVIGYRVETITVSSGERQHRLYSPGKSGDDWLAAYWESAYPEGYDFNYPAYSTDPSDADLVRLEIERRGWGLNRFDYVPRTVAAFPWPYRAGVSWSIDDKTGVGELQASETSPHEALCRAFLLAHYAEIEQKEEATK